MELRFGSGEPLVSVVTVYNKPEVVERCLVASLRRQTGTAFEWIGVDNTASDHASAALALNAGARRARGRILLFTHQDVSLYGERWITGLERCMTGLSEVGVAGVVGPRASDGMMIGFMKDRKAVMGHPLREPMEVQTLDECVLAMRREVYERHPFDESIGGWHVYGVDACLRTRRSGLRTYVLPLFVHHDSAAINMAGLAEAHDRVYREHAGTEATIYTTCGVVTSPRAKLARRVGRGFRWGLRRVRETFRLPATRDHLSVVQELARGRERVLVMDFFPGERSGTWPTSVEAQALDAKAPTSTSILHRVVLPEQSPGDVLRDGVAGGPAQSVIVHNLSLAGPEQRHALRTSLGPEPAEVWVIYSSAEREAVRRAADEQGWTLAREQATRPFTGPAPVFVAELR